MPRQHIRVLTKEVLHYFDLTVLSQCFLPFVTEHQFLYRLCRRFSFKQNLIYLLNDRHADLIFLGKGITCLCGINALHHHLDLFHGLFHGCSLADQNPGSPVAGMHGRTGHDQVANACQAVKGFQSSAHLKAQPCDLCNAPGDQGCLGIVSIAKSIGNSGGKRHNIFRAAPSSIPSISELV